MTARHNILVFIHVPKTGGMTIDDVLRKNFGAAYVRTTFNRQRGGLDFLTPQDMERDLVPLLKDARAVSGHLLRPPVIVPDARALYVTMIRDPFSWALSHYFHSKRRKWIPADTTLEAYLTQHYGMPNYQTHHFASSGLASDAVSVLDGFMVVGVTDMVPQFLQLLRARLKHEMGLAIRTRHGRVNAASNRSRTPQDLTGLEVRKIIELFGEDLKLYHYARHRLLRDWSASPGLTRVLTHLTTWDRGGTWWEQLRGRASR